MNQSNPSPAKPIRERKTLVLDISVTAAVELRLAANSPNNKPPYMALAKLTEALYLRWLKEQTEKEQANG